MLLPVFFLFLGEVECNLLTVFLFFAEKHCYLFTIWQETKFDSGILQQQLSVLMHPTLPVIAFIRKWSHVNWFTKACRWHYLRSKTPQAHKSIRPPPKEKNPIQIFQKKGERERKKKKKRTRKLQILQTSYMLIIFSKRRSHRKIIIFILSISFSFFSYFFFFRGEELIGGLHKF